MIIKAVRSASQPITSALPVTICGTAVTCDEQSETFPLYSFSSFVFTAVSKPVQTKFHNDAALTFAIFFSTWRSQAIHVSFRLLQFVLRCFITHLPWRCCQSVFNSYIQCWRLGGCNTLACARRQTSGWNVSVINDNSTTANNQTPTLDYNYDKEHGLPKKQMQLLTIKCFSVRVKYG